MKKIYVIIGIVLLLTGVCFYVFNWYTTGIHKAEDDFLAEVQNNRNKVGSVPMKFADNNLGFEMQIPENYFPDYSVKAGSFDAILVFQPRDKSSKFFVSVTVRSNTQHDTLATLKNKTINKISRRLIHEPVDVKIDDMIVETRSPTHIDGYIYYADFGPKTLVFIRGNKIWEVEDFGGSAEILSTFRFPLVVPN